MSALSNPLQLLRNRRVEREELSDLSEEFLGPARELAGLIERAFSAPGEKSLFDLICRLRYPPFDTLLRLVPNFSPFTANFLRESARYTRDRAIVSRAWSALPPHQLECLHTDHEMLEAIGNLISHILEAGTAPEDITCVLEKIADADPVALSIAQDTLRVVVPGAALLFANCCAALAPRLPVRLSPGLGFGDLVCLPPASPTAMRFWPYNQFPNWRSGIAPAELGPKAVNDWHRLQRGLARLQRNANVTDEKTDEFVLHHRHDLHLIRPYIQIEWLRGSPLTLCCLGRQLVRTAMTMGVDLVEKAAQIGEYTVTPSRQKEPVLATDTTHAPVHKRKTSKRKRGRPSDSNPIQDRRLFEAWATAEYKTYTDLARAFKISERNARLGIGRHKKRISRAKTKSDHESGQP